MSPRARKVGRPKAGEKPKRASAKAREIDRESILYMKGSAEYFDFLDQIYRKTGIPKVTIFRFAFKEWCERNGHGTPPEI